MQPYFGNTKFGYYSADPFDAFHYAGRRDLPGPTSVFKIDLSNEFLTKFYKSKDFGTGSLFDAKTDLQNLKFQKV